MCKTEGSTGLSRRNVPCLKIPAPLLPDKVTCQCTAQSANFGKFYLNLLNLAPFLLLSHVFVLSLSPPSAEAVTSERWSSWSPSWPWPASPSPTHSSPAPTRSSSAPTATPVASSREEMDMTDWEDRELGSFPEWSQIQGCPSGCTLPFVDIKTKVWSQYKLLIVKCDFQFDVNSKVSVQPDGPPCNCLKPVRFMFSCFSVFRMVSLTKAVKKPYP